MTVERTKVRGFFCGSSNPPVGSRVPMRRQLHDNGFGMCYLMAKGLYGSRGKPQIVASFSVFPSRAWEPNELPPRSLSWVEKHVKTWDEVWPDAEWTVELAWPWQAETWTREKPGRWIVTKSSDRGVAA